MSRFGPAFAFDADLGKIFVTSGTGVIGYRCCHVVVGVWTKRMFVLAHTVVSVTSATWGEGGGSCRWGYLIFGKHCKGTDRKGRGRRNRWLWLWTVEESVDTAIHRRQDDLSYTPTYMAVRTRDNHSQYIYSKSARDASKIEHFVKVSFLHNNDDYTATTSHSVLFTITDVTINCKKFRNRLASVTTILATAHLMTPPLVNTTRWGIHQTSQIRYSLLWDGCRLYVSPNDVADAAMVVLMDLKNQIATRCTIWPTHARLQTVRLPWHCRKHTRY